MAEKNKIQESYIQAMIGNIKKFGEYIIIAPNVAMPHSRPEDGVNESCLALLKLHEPVKFDNGDAIYQMAHEPKIFLKDNISNHAQIMSNPRVRKEFLNALDTYLN